jgi:pyrroloquinoline quinone biosynthesis protein D
MSTPKIDRDDRVAVPEHVRFRQFDDELVLVDLAGGEYFSLNAVGTRIWRAAATGKTPVQIAASLAHEYEVEEDTALLDCLHLLDQLLERGLVARPAL